MLKKTFIPDVLAGLTVSFAALSLGAAFGSLSGRGAFAGMIAAAIIPIITSLFGGTRRQASGPTAPMTAVSSVVVAYAYDQFQHDLVVAEKFITLIFLMTGLFLVIAGIIRLGKFISYVPNVVILGFMNGIALLIWFDQLKKLFGFGDAEALEGGIIINVGLTIVTLGFIFFIPWLLKKLKMPDKIRAFFPGILITIVIMTIVTTVIELDIQRVALGSEIESARDYLHLIEAYLPSADVLSMEILLLAAPYALQLTLLAYLDSLLTALVMDKLTREKTKLNKEVIAQGIANSIAALLQGIPGAQATIRSVLLFNEGARTRLAGVFVGVFTLLGLIAFQNYITLIASAIFVGVLIKVGWDVFDKDFLRFYFKKNWKKARNRNIQLGFIAYTTIITVIFDLNVAVISGTVLYYISRRLFKVKDAESDFEQIPKEEAGPVLD